MNRAAPMKGLDWAYCKASRSFPRFIIDDHLWGNGKRKKCMHKSTTLALNRQNLHKNVLVFCLIFHSHFKFFPFYCLWAILFHQFFSPFLLMWKFYAWMFVEQRSRCLTTFHAMHLWWKEIAWLFLSLLWCVDLYHWWLNRRRTRKKQRSTFKGNEKTIRPDIEIRRERRNCRWRTDRATRKT